MTIIVDENQAVKKKKRRAKVEEREEIEVQAEAKEETLEPAENVDGKNNELEKIEEEIKNEIAVRNVKADIDDLVEKILKFCEVQAGIELHPYQKGFAKRIIESVLLNDGDEITALFSRQCIAEGSIIHTQDGRLVRIEEHPNAWLTDEKAELLEIHIRGGHIVRCTKNHPIMTEAGWIPAGLLREGDKVVVLDKWKRFGDGYVSYSYEKYVNMHRTDKVEGVFEMNDELAELVGWLTTDGSISSKKQSLKFTNIRMEYLKRVEYLVLKYFKDVKVKWYKKGNGYDLVFSTGSNNRFNSLKDFISIMDYDVEKFPKSVNYFTESQICAMFRAMFASDGYVHQRDEKNVEIGLACKNSRTYAEFFRELLNKLGIRGQIKEEYGKKSKRPFYRILISGQRNIQVFKETIGSIPLKEIPSLEYTRENEVRTFKNVDGEEFYYSRITSIREAGYGRVWDVEYPNKGWFIVGGTKVHNSGKTETVAVVLSGLMVILPILAKMMPENEELQQYKDGVWIGK